ncbi:GNAT family N-acetyltransferase [Streptomyces montanus]|uniref:GNAT family N-acetyltransferase n=1 Tax=Streptomyces montanus TaxID=2580423 RepID=A0A5R9FQC9_9ACTN|nr:GNAT family N-acetyltransferase [Streptomyces montanus]TLS44140.1 GNAT family N-acetyltransferase [Streptomyces montanus]
MSIRLRTAHTADLAPAELRAVRGLLDDAFEGDFSDQDWDHTLGGIHALVHDDTGLVAHGAVIQRRVLHHGRSLRTGYVEGVAVRADSRRRGLGGRVMAALERVIDGAYALGALSATDEGGGLYAARGWQRWPGRVHVLGPDGIVRLPEEEGATFVRPASTGTLDPLYDLIFDWRDGDVL